MCQHDSEIALQKQLLSQPNLRVYSANECGALNTQLTSLFSQWMGCIEHTNTET